MQFYSIFQTLWLQIVQDLFGHLTYIPWKSAITDANIKFTQLSIDLEKDIGELKTMVNAPSSTSSVEILETGCSATLTAKESVVDVNPCGMKQADSSATMQDVCFDPDRMLCCSVENGHTLVHGVGGRGYGLAATAVTAGCYQWKV